MGSHPPARDSGQEGPRDPGCWALLGTEVGAAAEGWPPSHFLGGSRAGPGPWGPLTPWALLSWGGSPPVHHFPDLLASLAISWKREKWDLSWCFLWSRPLLSSDSAALGPALPSMGRLGGHAQGCGLTVRAQPLLGGGPGAQGLGRYRPSLGVQGTGRPPGFLSQSGTSFLHALPAGHLGAGLHVPTVHSAQKRFDTI